MHAVAVTVTTSAVVLERVILVAVTLDAVLLSIALGAIGTVVVISRARITLVAVAERVIALGLIAVVTGAAAMTSGADGERRLRRGPIVLRL